MGVEVTPSFGMPLHVSICIDDIHSFITLTKVEGFFSAIMQIDLFINSDAILNRDALWSIQGKKHYLQAAIVGGIHHT